MNGLAVLVIFLLAASPPAKDTLHDYVQLRSRLDEDVRKLARKCQTILRMKHRQAAGRIELRLRIDADGKVVVGTYATNGFVGADPLPAEAYSCLRDGISGLRLPPPPAGNTVRLCLPVTLEPIGFQGIWLSRPGTDCERTLQVFPPEPDPMQVFRGKMAEVVFQNKHEIGACLASSERDSISLRWSIAGTGAVAMVDLPKNLPVELRKCVRRAVIRWKFARPPDHKTLMVTHSFHAEP